MAALEKTHPTLLDLAKRQDPDGKIAQIVEIMNAENEILTDMTWQEGNLETGHKTTVRTEIPEPTWRKLYGGVKPTKSGTAQVTDTCGMLEAYAETDKALADLNGNTAAFRLSEESAHIEGIAQKLARTVFYGNELSEAAAFTGLGPRFNSLSAQNADNIIDAFSGSGGDLTSIWLCVWGPQTGFGIVPKGSKAGLQMTDKGQVTIENVDGNGGRMEGYRTHYRQDAGLCVRDWRYFVRVANIDISELSTLANTKNLITWMVMASERIPSFGKGRACWYVNRTIREKLRLGILEKIATNLTWETVEGKRVMTFDDIPVRRTDSLLNTESRVVA
ncbi:hypothetical protein SOM08_06175 [Hydrogenophaga sp. SNF1]|jgi:hypothetical protein|uniref:major capsid protein n=1 Tax=Hydrogenophaga sp. SNF1 TaxID=3098762 RepID=UPI002ACC28DE|nr:hypothetical protein [Hydrogenophaga sp. SNF1]WQB84898.1 hypothetical protein SOM08_06175 [Hydrogenophaga sp. SNF1]